MAREGTPWRASLLEARCLKQLDREENWQMLDRPKPPIEEILPWKPFRRIFFFNVVFFLVALSAASGIVSLFAGFGFGLGGDVGMFCAFVLIPTTLGMAGYATWLYRSSWNRRARSYLED